MSYVNSVLQPGERIIVVGRLHWIIYWHAIVLLVLGLVWWRAVGHRPRHADPIAAIVFAVLFVVSFAWPGSSAGSPRSR